MKIAIIGSGISGLSAAYLLNKHHDITLFEKNDYLGGHARTVNITVDKQQIAVDTGFIVFNKQNYPNLTKLFEILGVKIAKSDMSFGVSINNGQLEYGTRRLSNLFAQKRNLFRPQFWGMLYDILKFNKKALKFTENDSNLTIGDLLTKLKLGEWFKNYYLLAMCGSIWSTPANKILHYPAASLIRFFHNHGLLTIANQPQWYTVINGSKEYIKLLTQDFKQKIYLNTEIKNLINHNNKTVLITQDNIQYEFDKVIFATHPTCAIKIINNIDPNQNAVLKNFECHTNHIVLHSDERFMQHNKKAWASWVFLANSHLDEKNKIGLSYWMNNLQPLNTNTPIIATLNPIQNPKSELIYDQYSFKHPFFDTKTILAQTQIDKIQGINNIYYCGAWQQYGFHEDGLVSAIKVAKLLGVKIPWE